MGPGTRDPRLATRDLYVGPGTRNPYVEPGIWDHSPVTQDPGRFTQKTERRFARTGYYVIGIYVMKELINSVC